MSPPSGGASFAGSVWRSSCSRLLASFESNPEAAAAFAVRFSPFRPAFRDRSGVASAAAIGCDTAPVFIACLPRSRFVHLRNCLARLRQRLTLTCRTGCNWRLGIRRIGHATHLTRNGQRRVEQPSIRLGQLAAFHRAQNFNAAIELLGDDQGRAFVDRARSRSVLAASVSGSALAAANFAIAIRALGNGLFGDHQIHLAPVGLGHAAQHAFQAGEPDSAASVWPAIAKANCCRKPPAYTELGN